MYTGNVRRARTIYHCSVPFCSLLQAQWRRISSALSVNIPTIDDSTCSSHAVYFSLRFKWLLLRITCHRHRSAESYEVKDVYTADWLLQRWNALSFGWKNAPECGSFIYQCVLFEAYRQHIAAHVSDMIMISNYTEKYPEGIKRQLLTLKKRMVLEDAHLCIYEISLISYKLVKKCLRTIVQDLRYTSS